MVLYEQTRFGNLVEIGQCAISLLELATGSVQQEVTFAEKDGRTTIDSYRCNFHVHFQEKFTFILRLVEWKGAPAAGLDPDTAGFHSRLACGLAVAESHHAPRGRSYLPA